MFIQLTVDRGIAEGAQCVAGGPGRAEGFDRGYYVKPTVFANVTSEVDVSDAAVADTPAVEAAPPDGN